MCAASKTRRFVWCGFEDVTMKPRRAAASNRCLRSTNALEELKAYLCIKSHTGARRRKSHTHDEQRKKLYLSTSNKKAQQTKNKIIAKEQRTFYENKPANPHEKTRQSPREDARVTKWERDGIAQIRYSRYTHRQRKIIRSLHNSYSYLPVEMEGVTNVR